MGVHIGAHRSLQIVSITFSKFKFSSTINYVNA